MGEEVGDWVCAAPTPFGTRFDALITLGRDSREPFGPGIRRELWPHGEDLGEPLGRAT